MEAESHHHDEDDRHTKGDQHDADAGNTPMSTSDEIIEQQAKLDEASRLIQSIECKILLFKIGLSYILVYAWLYMKSKEMLILVW